MPATTTKVGPGKLTIGEAPLDVSCQILAGTVGSEVSAEDDREVLCGDTVGGDVTYSDTLTITLYQDLADASGLVRMSWEDRGSVVPFVYVPSTADGVQISGNVRLDPVEIGGEVGSKATSDATFSGVGLFTVGDVDVTP